MTRGFYSPKKNVAAIMLNMHITKPKAKRSMGTWLPSGNGNDTPIHSPLAGISHMVHPNSNQPPSFPEPGRGKITDGNMWHHPDTPGTSFPVVPSLQNPTLDKAECTKSYQGT